MILRHLSNNFRFRIAFYFLLALLPVLLFLVIAVEFFLIPPLERSIRQDLSNSTRILTSSLRAGATTAIKNHLKAIAERNRDIAEQQMALVHEGILTKDQAIKKLREFFLGQHIGTSGYIYCLNSEGTVVVHPNSDVEDTDSKGFSFVREQIKRKEGYIEYNWQNPGEKEPRQKALYMVYFKPLDWIISVSSYRSEFNELIDINDFRSAIRSVHFGITGYAFVLNKEGKVLIHPELRPLTDISQLPLNRGILGKLLHRNAGTIEYTWRNPEEPEPRKKMAVFEHIPELGWIVASSAYTDEIMHPVNLIIQIIRISTFLIVMGAIVAAMFLSGRLSSPIDQMMNRLNANARNGTLEPLPVTTDDEHGKLALEFNSFIETIRFQNERIGNEHARYRSLFETSPDAIILMRGLTLIDCNPMTSVIFSGDKRSLVGRTILELSAPDQFDSQGSSFLAEQIKAQTANHDLQTFKWIHKALDGRLFHAEVRLKPFGADNGEPLLVAFIRDITEQKKVEQALRLTQFSFDKASFGIFRSDMDGRIHDVNEQGCKSLGYTSEEICRMSIFDIDPSVTKEDWNNLWAKRIKSGSASFESNHRTKSGTTFPVHITSNLLEYEGMLYSIAFVRDITEEKEQERQKKAMEATLRQSQRMEALGTLAGGIAHDFNNILSAIMGYTELAQMETRESPKVQSYLAQLLDASGRAKNLVRQILSFSRRGVSEKRPVDLGNIVNEVLTLIRATIPATIEISKKICGDPGTVYADETQIHQVIMNLCTNAFQAMKNRDGCIEVELAPISIAPEDVVHYPDLTPGPYLKLSVTDNGHGISHEIIAKIFDPYFTTKPIGEGSGLGLSTVHGIVKDHGGTIKVYSELDCGTTFQIFLPQADERVRDRVPIELKLPKGKETILYVDDEKYLIEIVQDMLEGLGYTVEARADSIDALGAFKASPEKYDMVITDITMPKLSGLSLAAKIQEILPGIPIILCSGFSTRIDPADMKARGIRKVLMKPVTLVELATSVRSVLDTDTPMA